MGENCPLVDQSDSSICRILLVIIIIIFFLFFIIMSVGAHVFGFFFFSSFFFNLYDQCGARPWILWTTYYVVYRPLSGLIGETR